MTTLFVTFLIALKANSEQLTTQLRRFFHLIGHSLVDTVKNGRNARNYGRFQSATITFCTFTDAQSAVEQSQRRRIANRSTSTKNNQFGTDLKNVSKR